jgi:predicted GTPase
MKDEKFAEVVASVKETFSAKAEDVWLKDIPITKLENLYKETKDLTEIEYLQTRIKQILHFII